jgi:hypothetical protein
MIRFFLVLYISILFHFISTAQSIQLISEAKSLFEDQSNINNLELYGYFNDENEVQLYLAYNENEWKGYAYYPAAKNKIYAEGGVVRNNLVLEELDSNRMKIGMWLIAIDQINHQASWRDMSGNVTYELILKKLTDANKALDYRHSYCNVFEGVIDDQNYQLKVYINNGKKLRTSLMNYGKMYYYPSIPDCLDQDCSTFSLKIESEEGIKEIEFSPVNFKLINANVRYDNGVQKAFPFNETFFSQMKEVSYINNFYRIYFSLPNTKNQSLNDTLDNELKLIIDTLKTELDNCVDTLDETSTRLTNSATGWFDLGFINDDIYSGLLTVQSDCNEKIRTYPFVYNTKSMQKINIADQFTGGFNIKFFFSQYLKEKIKKIPEYKTPIFKNHLKPESFSNIYLSDQGIVFATDFNTLLGAQKIILPYSDLKGVIKRKSPLKKLVND